MIQASLLAQGTAAALTSTSTSYSETPLTLPTAFCLAEEPPKRLSFGAKSKNSFLPDLTFLPSMQ